MLALRLARFSAAVLLATIFVCPAGAQSFVIGPLLSGRPEAEQQVPPPEAAPQASAAEKRAANAEQLRLAQRKLEAGGSADAAASQDVAYHQSLEAVLTQQQAVEQQIKDLEAQKAVLESELQSPSSSGPSAAAVSFVELDALKDELAAERARIKLLEDKLEAGRSAVDRAQRHLDDSNAKLRQAQAAFESGKDSSGAAELVAAADRARQTVQLAAEALALRKREVAREQLAQEVQRLAVRLREQQVARTMPLVVFTKVDYEEQLDDIAKKEESANKSLARAQASLHSVEMEIQHVQELHDAETGDRTVLAERLEAQRRARNKLSDEIDSLTWRLQRLAELRIAWHRRFQIASSDLSNPEKRAWNELKEWQKDTKKALEDLVASLRTQILRMRDLRSTLTSITKKIDAAKNGSEDLLPWLEMQRSQVEAMLRTRERDMLMIETSRRVHEKLLDEIGLGVQALSPKTLALGAWYQTERIWNLEIASIDTKAVYVKNIVTGVGLFVGGWIVSRFLAALFAYRLLKRFRLSKDGTAAIRTLVFYALLTIAAVAALRAISIPLTAFTILGGALAIAVGFGSQALINNFIGGLIMLAERPVRLGERINFGKYEGVVEDVGFRCTRLRTMTDHLVTIPNSTLVNESIENVARRRTIRRKMDVTITYDTPREKVAAAVEAIRNILEEKDIRERIHPIVGFEELPPRVFFNDFNAESLNILVIYWFAPNDWWSYVEHCERVNFRIMEEFARLGVEFAFPSRTVYVKNADRREPESEVSRNGHAEPAAQPFA